MLITPINYEANTAYLSNLVNVWDYEVKQLEKLRTEPILTKIEVLYVEADLRQAREIRDYHKKRLLKAQSFGLSKFPFCNKI